MLHTSKQSLEGGRRTAITKVSIKEQVYEYLKTAIVKGTLEADTIYSEQMIADQLHVSRTPVREAIQLLKHENLVEIYSNRGFGIKEISAADVEEIIQARMAIEEFGIRMIIHSYDTERGRAVLRKLAACVEKTRTVMGNRKKQYEFTQADVAFHRLLVEFTQNPYLLRVSDMIHTKQEQATVHSLHDEQRMAKAVEEHEDILRFLEQGDEKGALQSFKKHMDITRDILNAAGGFSASYKSAK